MGSCSFRKKVTVIQDKPQVDDKPDPTTLSKSPDFVFHRSGVSIFDRFRIPAAAQEIKPYDPYCINNVYFR